MSTGNFPSHLTNSRHFVPRAKRKHSVRINSVYSSFQEIVSGVPQGSVLSSILFKFYVNDLFSFIKQAIMYNYAYDKKLAFFSNPKPDFVKVLEKIKQKALFHGSNKMK